MRNETYVMFVLLATFVPAVLFGLIALLYKTPKSSTVSFEDEFLLAGRDVKTADFVNSSAGYMLQVSTTFYFIYWGYNYGLSNIFYLLSWAVGIVIFAAYAPALLQFRSKFRSLPEYISNGQHSVARKMAAWATIISFVGVFYVESYFTADFITTIATTDASTVKASSIWWIIFATITIVVLIYSVSGGLRKVILTDTWQLAGAYIGLATVFAYLLKRVFQVDMSTGAFLATLCIVVYLSLLVSGWRANQSLLMPMCLIIGIGLILYVTYDGLIHSTVRTDHLNVQGILKQVREPWGWVTLLGFTLINVLWQFCDNSNFQRIGALKLPEDPSAAEAALRKAIRKLIVVSPLTWGLGIILGMLIKAAAIAVAIPGTEYQTLVNSLKQDALGGSISAMVVICALVLSLVSIMMSTCDTALLAAIQASHADLRKESSLTGKYLFSSSIAIVFLIALIAFIHRATGSASILTVMAGVYSAILVLFPVSFSLIIRRPVSSKQTIAAIICGLALNFYATFLAPSWIPYNVSLVLPIFAGLGGSIFGFLVFKPRRSTVRGG